MKANSSWRIRLAQILLGSAIVLTLVVPRGTLAQGRDHRGQDLKGWDGKAPENRPVHLTTDWSHRHLVFSPPKGLIQQFRLSGNVRYVQQWMRRNAERRGVQVDSRWGRAGNGRGHHGKPLQTPDVLQKDWSLFIGAGATVGAGNYPAKYSFDATSATCAELGETPLPSPDFVVYNTGQAGSATQATIIAFTNLYVGTCSTVGVSSPNTYWVYNTGTAGAVVTSPILSGDGTQVAFVQGNGAGNPSNLVLLKWAPYDGGLYAPTDITDSVPDLATATTHTVSNANYRTCTAPCMTAVPFAGGASRVDTNSSPFYDYAPGSDTLYVGDDTGYLHKFTGVFHGLPADTDTFSPQWPAILGGKLTSPVYDEGTNKVFVGNTNGTGYLYSVDASTGAVVTSAAVGDFSGINDSPILDTTNGNVYVIVPDSTATPTGNETAVYQFTTGFTAGATGTQTILTGSNTGNPVYMGDFDNAFYNGGAGHMYVCASSTSTPPTLYQIDVSASGVLGTVNTGPALATNNGVVCSGVTEVFNPNITSLPDPSGTDLIFTSVRGSGQTLSPIFCPTANGCLMSFDVTSGAAITPSTTTAATIEALGGTSGIVIDNSSAVIGASQVYYTPLADQLCTSDGKIGGCAIQASQSTLH